MKIFFYICLVLLGGCSNACNYGGWKTKKVIAKYYVHQTHVDTSYIIMAEDGFCRSYT
jgi:hypothetical protein